MIELRRVIRSWSTPADAYYQLRSCSRDPVDGTRRLLRERSVQAGMSS